VGFVESRDLDSPSSLIHYMVTYMVKATRKPGTRKFRPRNPDASREDILNAAFVEFCTHGLAGARVDRIAERAKLNKRLLYHYFGNKEQLFQELLRRKAGQAREERETAPAALADFLPWIQKRQCEDVEWTRLITFEALSYGADEIQSEKVRSAGWKAAINGLRGAQRDGQIAPELDARFLQLCFVALVTFPVAFPQFTKMITGLRPDEPAFLRNQNRFLRKLARRFSGEAPKE